MAALERAVPLAQNQNAVAVTQHLHLDVAALLDVRLDEDRAVPEGRLGLGLGGSNLAGQVRQRAHDAHPPSAAAGRCLHQQRQVPLRDRLDGVVGQHRYAGGVHQLLRLDLRAHLLDRLGRRADPGDAGGDHRPRKVGILGQEPVTGVDRVSASATRCLKHEIRAQVGLSGAIAGQPYGGVGFADERESDVNIRVHGNGLDAEPATRGKDPPRDLTAVGNQQSPDGGHVLNTP